MKIGIEEEFLVVDPETLFYTPGAMRIANDLIYQDIKYFEKSNIELPLNSNMLNRPISDFKKAFSVIEIKTDPHEEIDELKKELEEYRNKLVKVAQENNLLLLPAGLHPMHSKNNTVPDNCAALHIHIEKESERYYERLLGMIPFLISISANSPFYDGKLKAMSTRSFLSPHMGVPENKFKRTSDLIINKTLNTVEVRTLDTQITIDESLGLAEIISAIATNEIFDEGPSRQQYKKEKKKAILEGRGSVQISKKKYDVLQKSGDYAQKFLEKESGAEWQIELRKKFNLSTVVTSLWSSLKRNKKTVKKTSKKIDESPKWFNLVYILPYSVFLFIKKYKKYKQDLAYLDEYKDKEKDLF